MDLRQLALSLWTLLLLLVLMLCCVLLTSCTPAPVVGPAVNLQTVLTPDPLSQAPAPLPPTPTTAAPANTFRSWAPRQVTPNGDIETGHWVDVSKQPPAVEVQEPPIPFPRAPRATFATSKPSRGTTQPTRPAVPPAPVEQALPQGYGPQSVPPGYGFPSTGTLPRQSWPAPFGGQ